MVGALPDASYAINGTFVFGLPFIAYYVVAIPVALWIILEYTPTAPYLYAIGANQRAAELNGIPTRKFVIGAFVTSGVLTALEWRRLERDVARIWGRVHPFLSDAPDHSSNEDRRTISR